MGLARLNRGQLVLVAAAVIAIGLVPILFAYLQLGFHPDVDRTPAVAGDDAVAYLDRSVHDAAAATAGDYAAHESDGLADAVRDSIDDDIEALARSRLEEGVGYEVTYNATAAAGWEGAACETGPGARFGECAADGGVVVQPRAGDAVLVAVAFDVRAIGPESTAELTVVIDVGG